MSGEKEEMADILAEMRQDIADGTVCMWADFGGEIARGYVNRIEAAFNRAINARLRTDNSCVAQCAVLLDDHIKAIVSDVKKKCAK